MAFKDSEHVAFDEAKSWAKSFSKKLGRKVAPPEAVSALEQLKPNNNPDAVYDHIWSQGNQTRKGDGV